MNQTTPAVDFMTVPPTFVGETILAVNTDSMTIWRVDANELSVDENVVTDMLEGKRVVILRVPCCSPQDNREEKLLDRILSHRYRITTIVNARSNDYVFRKQIYLERY